MTLVVKLNVKRDMRGSIFSTSHEPLDSIQASNLVRKIDSRGQSKLFVEIQLPVNRKKKAPRLTELLDLSVVYSRLPALRGINTMIQLRIIKQSPI